MKKDLATALLNRSSISLEAMRFIRVELPHIVRVSIKQLEAVTKALDAITDEVTIAQLRRRIEKILKEAK
jgi:GTPase Era involved in 16S rRNA processing